MLAENAEMAVA